MQSMEEKKLPALEAALSTVEYKIKHLSSYYSYLEVRAWKTLRAKLKRTIRKYKKTIELREKSKPLKAYWYDTI